MSDQCNRPKLALASAKAAAKALGRRVAIHPASQAQAAPNLQVKAGRRVIRALANGPVVFPWEAD
jgi:hypothetical protein